VKQNRALYAGQELSRENGLREHGQSMQRKQDAKRR